MRIVNVVIVIFFLLSLVAGSGRIQAQQREDFKIFNDALELRIQGKWDQALKKYQLLKQKFPNSKYADDAEFWSAYILEEQGRESDAFRAYQQMRRRYPNSTWADDATMHQIGLAEKFVRQGKRSYQRFLMEQLRSGNKNIKYQAALSLGKLGDKRAIPVLREISNNGDKDMRSMGRSLLRKVDPAGKPVKPSLTPKIPPAGTKKGKLIQRSPRSRSPISTRPPQINSRKTTPRRVPSRSTKPKTPPPPKRKFD